MRLVELSRADHGHLRLSSARIKAVAAECHMVPLVASELRRAATIYPIVFAKAPDTGTFYPAALMGLEPHENLFWDGAEIDAAYVPLNLMRQPFYIGGEPGETGALCIDLDSPALGDDGDHGIVEEDGRDSRYITTVHAILRELADQQRATRAFVDSVLARDVLTELRLEIGFANASAIVLKGLYGIDAPRLARIVGEIEEGDAAMTLAAVALSLDHIAALVWRKNRQLAANPAWLC
jgi:hypothetical protein